jgi:hypothetical protein
LIERKEFKHVERKGLKKRNQGYSSS